MDSPIIILIFWVLLNLIIGNAKNKKKAQKKQQQTFNQDTGRKKNTGKQGPDLRKTLEEYRKQLEKEFGGQPEKKVQPQQGRTTGASGIQKPQMQIQRQPEEQKVIKPVEEEPMLSATEVEEGPQTEYISTKLKLDPKNDILKAIIYREILDKPKSLTNR